MKTPLKQLTLKLTTNNAHTNYVTTSIEVCQKKETETTNWYEVRVSAGS